MRALLGVVACVAMTTSVAHADDDDKSVTVATALSIGVPVAGLAAAIANGSVDVDRPERNHLAMLGLGLLVVGPSTGQWYAHRVGTFGLVARTVAALTIGYVLTSELTLIQRDDCLGSTAAQCADLARQQHRDEIISDALIYGSLAVLVGTAVYDTIVARRAVGEWNREHAHTVVTPTLITTPSGAASFGVAIGGRF